MKALCYLYPIKFGIWNEEKQLTSEEVRYQKSTVKALSFTQDEQVKSCYYNLYICIFVLFVCEFILRISFGLYFFNRE